MTNPAKSIRIGTMIQATEGRAPENIAAIADLGFESFQPFFWQATNGQDLSELGKRCLDAIGDRDITISTIGMFGNPLEDGEMDRATLDGWKACIDNAHHFGVSCVAGFAGRLRGRALTESLPRYREVWDDLARRGRRQGCPPAGYSGAIDIEGWHDPVYRDALEMTGQVRALNYLKQCRGGDFVDLAARYDDGDPSLR